MTELRGYQSAAVDWLRARRSGVLALEMGLGKTAIALRALTPEHLPALVVAPKRVAAEVWPPEAVLWRRDLRLALATGRPPVRAAALESGADLVVLGRDNLADALPHAEGFRTLILDELSGFKDRTTARWKTARKLADAVDHVWGLTGTPAPNGLIDLWAQIALLDRGERLGKTLTAYRGRYFMPGRQLPNGVITEWILRPEAADRIHELLDDIMLSMSNDGRVELPPVTYNELKVTLPAPVRRVYRDLKRNLVANVETLGEVYTAANAAVLSGKLSQVNAGFIYPDEAGLSSTLDYDVLHREKVAAVSEVVEGNAGSPVLVFYRFRAERDMLQKAFPTARHINDRGVVSAWNAGLVPILLAHPASAGHGLNLQHGGHTIVWTSLPWSLEEWEQGNARLNRPGQRFQGVVHMVMVPRSIDSAIRTRLEDKTTAQQALLHYLETL